MSESPYFNLPQCAPCHRFIEAVFTALNPWRAKQTPPNRWVLNQRAKAPLHFIYRPGELDSLERADVESGWPNKRRSIFASDGTKLVFLWERLPAMIFAARCHSHKKCRPSLEQVRCNRRAEVSQKKESLCPDQAATLHLRQRLRI